MTPISWTRHKWSLFGLIGETVFCHISLTKNKERINATIFAPIRGVPYRYVHHIRIDLPTDFTNDNIDLLCEQTLANAKAWVESEEGREKIAKIQKEVAR